MEREDTGRLPEAAREEKRKQVIRLRCRGVTYSEIADQTGFSKTSVFNICRRVEERGPSGTRERRRGRREAESRHLSVEREQDLQRVIGDKRPDQLKLLFALWSRRAVQQLIQDRCGVKLAVRTVGNYLARWGFTPQKPIKKAYEQRPAAVRQWLDEEYPVIAERAKADGAEIHWGDGRSMPPAVCGPTMFKVFDGALNTESVDRFLRAPDQERRLQVFLVLDNLRVHHAKLVKARLAEHQAQIEVFYLPSYSPELNPDEMLNADLKQAVTSKAPARTQGLLRKAAISHLRRLHQIPRSCPEVLQHRPVRYAA